MFNLQGSEVIIILLLALVVLGPEKLPDAMRRAGKFYAEIKKMSTGFQSEFRAAVDEPLRELRETAQSIRDSADFTKLSNGERPEKPKSADMLAPADPDAVPTDDLPFRPDDAGRASTSPSDQEPFASVVVSGGRANQPPTDDESMPGSEPVERPEAFPSIPFSGSVVSSASPPQRRRPAPAGQVSDPVADHPAGPVSDPVADQPSGEGVAVDDSTAAVDTAAGEPDAGTGAASEAAADEGALGAPDPVGDTEAGERPA